MGVILDISHYHPVTNWSSAKKNCDLLISKATQSINFMDSTLKTFVAKCEANKIPYYLYTFLVAEKSITAQCDYMFSKCKDIIGDYFCGYAIDCELNPTTKTKPTNAQAEIALEYIIGKGYRCAVYTGYSDYSRYAGVIKKAINSEKSFFWEARYGSNNGQYNPKNGYCHDDCELHQYSSQYRMSGISGGLDINRLTGKISLDWLRNCKAIPCSEKKHSSTTTTTVDIVFPSRGYYMKGDGTTTNTSDTYKKYIKMIQKKIGLTGNQIDGHYGSVTEKYVKEWQKKNGITTDGQFGKQSAKQAGWSY